jgi:hypothetical protein
MEQSDAAVGEKTFQTLHTASVILHTAVFRESIFFSEQPFECQIATSSSILDRW